MPAQTKKAPTVIGAPTVHFPRPSQQTGDRENDHHDTRGIGDLVAHARAYSAALIALCGGVR